MNGRLDIDAGRRAAGEADVFAEELAARERIATHYDAHLGNAVMTPARVPDSTSAWAIYSILLRDAAARDRVQANAHGVPTAIYYPGRCTASPPIATSMTARRCRFRRIWRAHPGIADPCRPGRRPRWRMCATGGAGCRGVTYFQLLR